MTALLGHIRALIAQEGPISIARYMDLSLAHPVYGYYMTRDPLGEKGDFTTAPEISQIFGELLGLWMAEIWRAMGAPARVILAECGPGRGTLMADMLRAARVLPAFRKALEVHLVEISPVLRTIQAQTLASSGVDCTWHASLDEVPRDAPLLLVANEFLDALPIRQFVRQHGGWHERLVGSSEEGLAFGLSGAEETTLGVTAPDGVVREICPAGLIFMAETTRRLVQQGGAALLLDYGHVTSDFGDTLQAMHNHQPVDPLSSPGEADLTAHVDFQAMGAAARQAGGQVHGPVEQGAFLLALGLAQRAAHLASKADPSRQADIAAQVERLTDMGRTGMGRLFKVMAVTAPGADRLPGFA